VIEEYWVQVKGAIFVRMDGSTMAVVRFLNIYDAASLFEGQNESDGRKVIPLRLPESSSPRFIRPSLR